MPRHVLVLTATGATGQHTVSALLDRGARVRAATRTPGGGSLPAAVEQVRFELSDPTTYGPALEGIDAVYFCLPPWREDEVARGTEFLNAAVAAGVKRVVKLSASGIEGMPESAHFQLEQVIAGLGVSYVHLRPTFFMDNFITFYGHGIASDGVIALPAGEGKTGFVSAKDIGEVAAIALLGDQSGEAWTLTGPEALTHAEVAAQLTAVLGRPVRFVDLTPEAHVQGMRAFGAPEIGVQVMSALYGFVRQGWTGGLTDTVAQVTGHPPQSFVDWAKAHADAWR